MSCNKRLQLRHRLGAVPTAGEMGVELVLEGAHPQLLKSGGLFVHDVLVLEISERRPPPKRQRTPQQFGRAAALLRSELPRLTQ